MHLKKTILVLLTLYSYLDVASQSTCKSIFIGQVLDEAKQPVIGATVLLLPQNIGQVVDLSGNFKFENVCPGNYKVRIQFLGYEDEEFELQIKDKVNRVVILKEDVKQLGEVVVEAHHDAAHTEYANSFTQLSEKQLDEVAGKSLGESLKEVAGVNSIQTGPGIFKPVIHGVHSQRVLILNYGIRQEGQQWGAEHAPEIDPFIASNIIVIKDASAIKYGTDALGGVIVVNPPELPRKAELGGTFNTILQSNGQSGTVSGMLEGGIKNHDGWGWRMQGTGKRSGDFHTPDYSLTNTGIKELNFSTSTGYHKDNAGFDIFFSHFKTELGVLKGTAISSLEDLANAMEREEPLYTSGFSYQIGEPRQEVSHNLLKINGHMLTKHGEWKLQYGFQNNNRREFDIRKGDLSKIPAIDLKLNTHTLDTEWETLHSDKRTISFGISGMYQNNQNIFGTQRLPFIPNFVNLSGGIFAVTKLFLNNWVVDLGTRYDYRYYDVKGFDYKNTRYANSFSFNNISASAGATLTLPNDQTLNLNLSSAWRPPHVAELYSVGTHQSAAAIEYGLLLNDSTNEVMNIKDVNFKTEQAVKFVASYTRTWQRFAVEVSPYVNYILNYIYLRPEGITKNVRGVYPYYRYTQTDALFTGVDVTGTWHASKYLKVLPKVSLLQASDVRNNDYLVFIPSNRYELAVRYDRPSVSAFKNFYVESKLKYVAKQHRAPRVITVRQIIEADEQNVDIFANDNSNFDFMDAPNGYGLLNLAVGASLKRDRVQYDFRVAAENALNQSYREYTNRFRYYANDVGRNFIFSLKCIF
jgi:iron complex outermembrane recepter protein